MIAKRELITTEVVLPPVTKSNAEPEDWRSRLSTDRPVYACPACSEAAMQFYADHDSHPGRKEFFHCHACGMYAEM